MPDLFTRCLCPQFEAENNARQTEEMNSDEVNYDLNARLPPPSPPPSADTILYRTHHLSTLQPIVVQPPPNRYGAQGMRVLTPSTDQSTADIELLASTSSAPGIYVLSYGGMINTTTRPPEWDHNALAPGRAVRLGNRTRTHKVHAPPEYSENPPSRGGAETAEPPEYPEEEPALAAVPEYPGRGDGTMSAPSLPNPPQ